MAVTKDRIVIIGAGIGGLSAGLELAASGADVTILETHSAPGGKMRVIPSPTGPVDAGPTVFTMRDVFEDLFSAAGTSLESALPLTPCQTLARHHWRDAPVLDLDADLARSISNIEAFAGTEEAARFATFTKRANHLFDAFEYPVMKAASPTPLSVTRAVLHDARQLFPAMAPFSTLWSALGRSFRNQKLQQLFGRYATYVGGSPFLSPALLMLIWASEQRGVWHVKGGMHQLATTLARLISERGGTIRYNTQVAQIDTSSARVSGVITSQGERIAADAVLFNGDPAALTHSLVAGAQGIGRPTAAPRRSLSAWVWTWASQTAGFDLAHHNVFFSDDSALEFRQLFKHRNLPSDPTLYLCAQDRQGREISGPERIQIIMNAPANGDTHTPDAREVAQCSETIFNRLAEAGLKMTRPASPEALTTPDQFSHLFPGTGGALYGANPHSPMQTFQRPTARTQIRGLYLCGGGCHPGPGVPMAALSGRHAAAAIIADRALTYRSIKTDMRGGTSTGSQMTAKTASLSSAS